MFQANYPVIGIQECYPVYLTGIGISDPEFHTHREEGLISHQILFTMSGKGKIIVGDKEYTAGMWLPVSRIHIIQLMVTGGHTGWFFVEILWML